MYIYIYIYRNARKYAVRLRIRRLYICILYIYARIYAVRLRVNPSLDADEMPQTFFKHYKLPWFARIKLINKKK